MKEGKCEIIFILFLYLLKSVYDKLCCTFLHLEEFLTKVYIDISILELFRKGYIIVYNVSVNNG